MSVKERLEAAATRTALCACIAALAGCGVGGGGNGATTPTSSPATVKRAAAHLRPKSGSGLSGTAVFVDSGGRVSLRVAIENAPPGIHACHIHEVGDCTAEDGSSAGGHWNPTAENHGRWGHAPFHLGDIGNIEVGEDGTGSIELSTDRWSLGGGKPGDILGRSVIIHAGADDFTTQPTGAAGGRIGCGVIEAS